MMRYYSTIISICLALIFFASAQISCTKDPSVPSMDYSLLISVDTSSITRTSVILKGYSSNLSVSVCGFEQSVDNENWKVITDKIKLNSSGYCNDTVSSLKPGSLYFFRFYSKMEGVRKKYSQSLAIKTKELSSPSLSMVYFDGESFFSSILDDGGRPIWSKGFIISDSPQIDSMRRFGRRIEGVLENDGKTFSTDMEWFDSDITYYIMAFASNYDSCSIYEGYTSEPLLVSLVSSVSLDSNIEMCDGESVSLTATILPANATNKSVTWSTSDETVATVSSSGVVTAVKPGTATITVKTEDGGYTATCNVTVWSAVPNPVDLGLSVKWASFNLGARKPEDYGEYYAWGEIAAKSNYDWSTYKYCNGSSNTLTKYCTDSSYGYNGFIDNKVLLEIEDDVAYVNLHGNWRMPTDAEWMELRNNCTWVWTIQNGVCGYTVSSKTNGNSIFLPAAGCRQYASGIHGYYGYYMSSSIKADSPYYAWFVYFGSSFVDGGGIYRCEGLSVRPVFK